MCMGLYGLVCEDCRTKHDKIFDPLTEKADYTTEEESRAREEWFNSLCKECRKMAIEEGFIPAFRIEKIASFNPFTITGFSCPACGSIEFVELVPYGGVWCAGCNAKFEVKGTNDGLRKVAVRCITEHCWASQYQEKADWYGTTIWQDDTEVHWFAVKDKKTVIH